LEGDWIATGDEISRGKGSRGQADDRPPSIVIYYNIITTTDGRGKCRARARYLKLAAACLLCDYAGPPRFFLFEKRRGRST
jgi:hypothetical protein